MGKAERLVKAFIMGLITAMGLVCVLFILQLESETIKVIDVVRGGAPISGTHSYSVQSPGMEKIIVQSSTNLLIGQVLVEVRDSNNREQYFYSLGKRDYRQFTLESLPGESISDGSWQLHVTEQGVVGRYRIVVARRRSLADLVRCDEEGNMKLLGRFWDASLLH
jgi:hypothetical protein